MLGGGSEQWLCSWASNEMTRHTTLQSAAACKSQPWLAFIHQGCHPSWDSNALLIGEVEQLGNLSKSSAMLTFSIITNTCQQVNVPIHKLPHTLSHVLPCNFSPKAQRPAWVEPKNKLEQCFSHQPYWSLSLMCCKMDRFYPGTGREKR